MATTAKLRVPVPDGEPVGVFEKSTESPLLTLTVFTVSDATTEVSLTVAVRSVLALFFLTIICRLFPLPGALLSLT